MITIDKEKCSKELEVFLGSAYWRIHDAHSGGGYGAIENLDPTDMIETLCLVSKREYEPLSMGKIPTL